LCKLCEHSGRKPGSRNRIRTRHVQDWFPWGLSVRLSALGHLVDVRAGRRGRIEDWPGLLMNLTPLEKIMGREAPCEFTQQNSHLGLGRLCGPPLSPYGVCHSPWPPMSQDMPRTSVGVWRRRWGWRQGKALQGMGFGTGSPPLVHDQRNLTEAQSFVPHTGGFSRQAPKSLITLGNEWDHSPALRGKAWVK
jgi:hypothetical protein